ncbi:21080_t:CDS:1, partial [Gigaspora margarita]
MRVNEHLEIESLRKSLDYQYNELIGHIEKLKGLYQYLIECGLVESGSIDFDKKKSKHEEWKKTFQQFKDKQVKICYDTVSKNFSEELKKYKDKNE